MNNHHQNLKSALIKYMRETRAQTNIMIEKLGLFLQHKEIKASETIIIAGSGRSGTTWIQNTLAEYLRFQPIFEPLNPNFIQEAKLLLGIDEERDPVVYSPYLRSDGDYPEWNDFLTRALTGQVRNYWTDKKRFTYFPQGYIAKFIRSNFMLGYIIKNFNSRVIFIMRHPCAVVYSRIRLNWQANKQNLFSQPHLIEDYLRPYLPDIEKENDPVGIHAIWWSLEQLIAKDLLGKHDHFFAHYEDVVRTETEYFFEMINWLGLSSQIKVRNSHPEEPGGHRVQDTSRIAQWVSGLNPDQIEKILWWTSRFDINHYSDQIYPVK